MIFPHNDKYGHIQDPSGKIPVDEPVFLIRGSDSLAVETVIFWARSLEKAGGDVQLVKDVMDHARNMKTYQDKNGAKLPALDHSTKLNENGENMSKKDDKKAAKKAAKKAEKAAKKALEGKGADCTIEKVNDAQGKIDTKEKKDKKGKKDKKAQDAAPDSVQLPENLAAMINAGDFSKCTGAAAMDLLKSAAVLIQDGVEQSFNSPIGPVSIKGLTRGGAKQTSWKLNDKRIAVPALALQLNQYDAGEVPAAGNKVDEVTPPAKPVLITQEQLEKKYLVAGLVDRLEFSSFGKKKQRAEFAEAFPKKKATGEFILSVFQDVFPSIPDADVFSFFEYMDNAPVENAGEGK